MLFRSPRGWGALRSRLTTAFASRTRDEWARTFEGTDACVTPVLTLAEAARHPHLAERQTLVEVDGVTQAAPAPRFSRSSTPGIRAPRSDADDVAEVLADWAVSPDSPAAADSPEAAAAAAGDVASTTPEAEPAAQDALPTAQDAVPTVQDAVPTMQDVAPTSQTDRQETM